MYESKCSDIDIPERRSAPPCDRLLFLGHFGTGYNSDAVDAPSGNAGPE